MPGRFCRELPMIRSFHRRARCMVSLLALRHFMISHAAAETVLRVSAIPDESSDRTQRSLRRWAATCRSRPHAGRSCPSPTTQQSSRCSPTRSTRLAGGFFEVHHRQQGHQSPADLRARPSPSVRRPPLGPPDAALLLGRAGASPGRDFKAPLLRAQRHRGLRAGRQGRDAGVLNARCGTSWLNGEGGPAKVHASPTALLRLQLDGARRPRPGPRRQASRRLPQLDPANRRTGEIPVAAAASKFVATKPGNYLGIEGCAGGGSGPISDRSGGRRSPAPPETDSGNELHELARRRRGVRQWHRRP